MGDGAVRQGSFHETLNLAMLCSLPVVFVVENNGYAISVPISEQTAGESIYKITAGYENIVEFNLLQRHNSTLCIPGVPRHKLRKHRTWISVTNL